jgi:hypothetical protein
MASRRRVAGGTEPADLWPMCGITGFAIASEAQTSNGPASGRSSRSLTRHVLVGLAPSCTQEIARTEPNVTNDHDPPEHLPHRGPA